MLNPYTLVLLNKNYSPLNKYISIDYMPLDRVLLMDINDTAAESAEQDQTARMCRLILLYTLRKKVHEQRIRIEVNIEDSVIEPGNNRDHCLITC